MTWRPRNSIHRSRGKLKLYLLLCMCRYLDSWILIGRSSELQLKYILSTIADSPQLLASCDISPDIGRDRIEDTVPVIHHTEQQSHHLVLFIARTNDHDWQRLFVSSWCFHPWDVLLVLEILVSVGHCAKRMAGTSPVKH
ncbi:hypothetical protein BDP27DRAFT_865342 [Rhodocollybia butyracea]|uniref:Uncharacterized protein n=1 Tax=Rhodocollybia butyracea TaxID=206335 RepID=A0A9P5P6R9_9AGAR|nr:hypothetical protein BDP27DRAFT_865342 [Rhodocollybia butyracea]